MVHYQWVETKKAYIFKLPITLPEDMCYMTGVFTIPQHRNKGIASKIKLQVCNYLKEKGFNQITEIVNASNSTALKIDKRLGFREYQIVHYKRRWHFRYFVVYDISGKRRKTYITIFKFPKHIWKTYLIQLGRL